MPSTPTVQYEDQVKAASTYRPAGFIAPLAPSCGHDHALLAPTRVVWG